MRLAAIQTDVVWQDPAANLANLDPLLRAATASGADLAVLPEMFATGFDVSSGEGATSGPTVVAFMADRAATLGMWIAGSVAISETGTRPMNQFCAVSPQGTTHRYAKRHLFTPAGEHHSFVAGNALVSFDVESVRITPFVCYDLRFAPEFWQCAPHTDLYLVVANWPVSRIDQWTVLLGARAVENQAFVLGVNRVGTGGDIRYGGRSMLVDPTGAVIAMADDTESMLVLDVDPTAVGRARAAFPALADRFDDQSAE